MAKKFEEAMAELENIVKVLDKGESTLDESMKLFEKGVKLAQYCQKLLDEAENKISIVAFNENGAELEDFAQNNQED